MKNNRNIIFKVFVAILFVAVSVLWVLSAVLPETFGGLSLAWLIAIFCFGLGVLFVVRGALSKSSVQIKKLYIFLGTIFVVAAVCALIGTFFKEVKVILPVISLVLALGALISALFTGKEKWDEGDNHKEGYKNYYERKAEKEQAENAAKAQEAGIAADKAEGQAAQPKAAEAEEAKPQPAPNPEAGKDAEEPEGK